MIECKDCKQNDNCPDRVAKLATADSSTRAVWSVWELSRNGANKLEKHGKFKLTHCKDAEENENQTVSNFHR